MSEKQEAFSDIIEKMRRDGIVHNSIPTRYLNDYADRLEAALKRELESVSGDATKLREALKAAKKYLDGYTVNILELRRTVDAALAAPPRNCDVPYNDRVEMYGAFKDWCNARGHTMNPKLACDAFDWLLAHATKKEGDAK